MSSLWFASVALSFAGAIACLVFFSMAAHRAAPLGIGIRTHEAFPPVLGGVAILAALVLAAWSIGIAGSERYLLLAMGLAFVAGVWSDLSVRRIPAFAAQLVATALGVWASGIEITSLGGLLGPQEVKLSAFALPFTVFAIMAVAYALNGMADLPGFRASFTFLALGWYAFAAASTHLPVAYQAALLIQGAVGGYLICNFLLLRKPYRHVFLGTGGGLMLGFALGWIAVESTQGPGRSFPPIAALWIVLLPLADSLSVALRRVARGQDVFEACERHLHHYLRIFLPDEKVLMVLIVLHALLGLAGYAGWRMGVPEPVMLLAAVLTFIAYHLWITRAWRRVAGYCVVTV